MVATYADDKVSDSRNGLGRAFLLSILTVAAILANFSQSCAMVGGAAVASGDTARATVTILGSGGNVCSGAVIAPNVIMTAAHCIKPSATYRVLDASTTPPRLVTASEILVHPKFDPMAMAAHRATADIALLRLPRAVPGKSAVPYAAPRIEQGTRFVVAGGGITRVGSEDGIGNIRSASLATTGKPGSLQIRLLDPLGRNDRSGLGACRGDSGGPVFQNINGENAIIGVIAWSTGPASAEGCGGLTGVTPVTLYIEWIKQSVRRWN